jgi:protein-tyrosine phosphatase
MSTDPTEIVIQTDVKKEKDPTLVRESGTTYHGNMSFDVPFISQIQDNLWQGGCENGLELPHFFKYVVSLYPWKQYAVKHEIDGYLTVRMFDSLDQQMAEVEAIAAIVNIWRKQGPVLVHCQAGLNRSGLVVCAALMQDGMTAQEAIALLRAQRSPASLCNPAFEEYLRNDREVYET